MSRIDRFEEILESYDGRKYEEIPDYKKNFCLVFEDGSLSAGTSDVIRANIKKILLGLPNDKSYAYIHTEPATGSILIPWIDDLESVLKLDEAELRKKQVRYGGTPVALKKLAKDRAFTGMIVTSNFIDPARSDGLYDMLMDLSKKGNKFCVIYFHERGILNASHLDLIKKENFSAIDPYADRYHVTCVKDLFELVNEYISYAIRGQSKPTRFFKGAMP